MAMVSLGFHLSNGFASALQSLGVLRSPWRPTLRPGGQRRGWVMVGDVWWCRSGLWFVLRAETLSIVAMAVMAVSSRAG